MLPSPADSPPLLPCPLKPPSSCFMNNGVSGFPAVHIFCGFCWSPAKSWSFSHHTIGYVAERMTSVRQD